MTCFLGLDIGTTSTIGILISLPDRVLAQTSRPVSFSAPKPTWAEEDPEEWWKNVCDIIPELLEKAGIKAHDIKGIGVTGMLPATILLDDNDKIIRPSIQQSDGRVNAEVEEIASEWDEAKFVARAGNGINQQLIATRLRWIEKHEPQNFARIETVFGSYDFINWRLTGKKAIEKNWALEAGFVNTSTNALDPELIQLGHIEQTQLPPLQESHEVLGYVSLEAARATGLHAGTPVIGGAADHIASAYAAGIASAGDVLLKFGGSTDILIATPELRPDPRMFLDYHLVPGLYMPNGCMASGGSALNWFVKNFAFGFENEAKERGISIHQLMDERAAQTLAGAEGVEIQPYFLGEKTPLHDPKARGIISGLSLNHNLDHMWRALLEGFGYAFKHHIEVFNDMGHPTTNYRASDGGSNSRFWMQICADILQEPIQLLKGHPGSCLGAGYLAALGVGATEDWRGVDKFVSIAETIIPNQENAEVYKSGYERFRKRYEILTEIYE